MNFLTFDEEYCVQQPFDPLGTVGKLAKYTILLHLYCVTTVSYTHLTLPTKRIV